MTEYSLAEADRRLAAPGLDTVAAWVCLGAACLLWAGHLRSEEADPAPEFSPEVPRLDYRWVADGLRVKEGPELLHVLKAIAFAPGLPRFADSELEELLKALERIRERDAFSKEHYTPEGIRETRYPNRVAANPALARLTYQRLVNPLHKAPMKKRIDRLIDYLEKPPAPSYELSMEFTNELIYAGKPGVPFIVQRKPKDPSHRRALVYALGRIGDPRGVDYLIDALKVPGEGAIHLRGATARALAGFKEEKVIQALINALRDGAYVEVEKKLPSIPGPEPKRFVGPYYLVRHEASESLSAITGHRWGFLLNEDHRAWSEWIRQGRKKDFDPLGLEISDEELAGLVRLLFDRYMSGRPERPGPEVLLGNKDGDRALADELRALGKRSVRLMVAQCRLRIGQAPIWEQELKRWTGSVLGHLEWPEAREAAAALKGTDNE